MKRSVLYLFISISAFLSCKTTFISSDYPTEAKSTAKESYDMRIVTYNVENLFDTKHDEGKRDHDFLPWGMNNWTQERYQTKLKKIFKVLANISEWEYPAIISLTEIENRAVLEDLISATPLSESDYAILHEESPDVRGIDVAILYKESMFQPISHEAILVNFPGQKNFKTRDILYTKGVVNKKDTLHFFVTHFPSRLGGEAESEPKRLRAATILRNKADSILIQEPNANIIITGDFNDDPTNASVYSVLRGKETLENAEPGDFFNMMYASYMKGYGSYKYQSTWNMLDQFIVSPSLLDKNNGIYTTTTSAYIFQPDWLSINDDRHPGLKPLRTYSGPNYIGGYSDHYPVFMDIYFNTTLQNPSKSRK